MLGTGLAFFCLTVFAQSDNASNDSSGFNQSETEGILGCLVGSHGEFEFTDSNGNVYLLTGNTAGLEKYAGAEISIEGSTHQDSKPFPTIDVIHFKEVFRAPKPKLSTKFADPSNWRTQTNQQFGVSLALPQLSDSTAASALAPDSNFAAQQGTTKIVELDIPRDVYADTNFVGGAFAIFVNPEIRNPESCRQFGTFDSRFLTSRTIGGIDYKELTDGDVAMGTSYSEYYFHTFQHNLCFELSFRLGEYNTGSQDLGCTVPIVGEDGFWKLIDALAGRVSFIVPTAGTAIASEPGSVPKINSFTASSAVADNSANRGVITFTWSSHATDYVALSFHCSVLTKPPVTILQEGGAGNCDNSNDRATYNTEQFHRSPNSSTDVTFGNMDSDDPITIAVTVTPFSHGKAYPSSSRSATVTVQPWNPFPEGVPAATRNMTLVYPAKADGTSRFEPGSSLEIAWTDSFSRDPCVNLDLVQDKDGGRIEFRLQLVKRCLTPSKNGSFTWKVPDKYSGGNFQIYGAAPGGESAAFGARFSIVPAKHGDDRSPTR